jgi:hypothetical protein
MPTTCGKNECFGCPDLGCKDFVSSLRPPSAIANQEKIDGVKTQQYGEANSNAKIVQQGPVRIIKK